ncbi:MAG: DUF1080 domain-containing protein [Verrucomicrobia bacterium]|nr:DUF1080 domain-containing protein [Verrucomicrobiota bacterium]
MSFTRISPLLRLAAIAALVVASGPARPLAAAEPKWTPLFDGKSLAGWKQLGGEARFVVRDGAIVGLVTEGVKQNSFLTTEALFGDFVFECEFKAADGINSGVQYRSAPPSDTVKRVHGYQCEIDPTPRGLTGGLYEEGRRGWFSPKANNGEPQKTWATAHAGIYRSGEWNKLRIEARGHKLRHWLNGRLMVEFEDTDAVRIPRGFFGLQVHATTKSELFNREVAFRNLRVQKLD